MATESGTEKILGIAFFDGTALQAVERAMNGGLVVAPSGTCFERFVHDAAYRRAILSADVVLPDSGLMVLLWRLLRRRSLQRISGLAYLKRLISHSSFRESDVLWVLPNERSREKLLNWANIDNFPVTPEHCHIAPIYGVEVKDAKLLARLEALHPLHSSSGSARDRRKNSDRATSFAEVTASQEGSGVPGKPPLSVDLRGRTQVRG